MSQTGPPGQQAVRCVYGIGGDISGASAKAELYNYATNGWTTVAPLRSPRMDQAAVGAPCAPTGDRTTDTAQQLAGNCVYAVGGRDDDGNGGGTMEVYNPRSNAWTTRASMPTPRRDLAAAAAPCSGRQKATCVYVMGGKVPGGDTTLAKVEV